MYHPCVNRIICTEGIAYGLWRGTLGDLREYLYSRNAMIASPPPNAMIARPNSSSISLIIEVTYPAIAEFTETPEERRERLKKERKIAKKTSWLSQQSRIRQHKRELKRTMRCHGNAREKFSSAKSGFKFTKR